MNHRAFSAWRPPVLALLIVSLAHPAFAQGFKWWHSERFQQELQLTADQIARIDEIFQSSLPELRQQKSALDRLERELDRLIDGAAEERVVMEQADRVESVRSDLSKARTRMLLRMRRVLTEDQRLRFTTLHEEWERSRKQRQDKRK